MLLAELGHVANITLQKRYEFSCFMYQLLNKSLSSQFNVYTVT